MKHEAALNDIVKAIEKATAGFEKSLPSIERELMGRVMELAKELKTSGGRISMVGENVRKINQLRAQMERLISGDTYTAATREFLKTFEAVTTLQNNYFSLMVTKFKPPKVLKAVREEAVLSTAQALTESGVHSSVTAPIQELLRRNINEGGSFASLLEDMRGMITSTKDAPGILARYASQITTDALNQYSATYNETISADLGFKWRMYTGSLLETSRAWCVHMVGKKYVHISELQTIITDHIDGVKICSDEIPCSKKTGLPRGMIKGTDATNIAQRRGGWKCGHQFGGVSEAVVPQHIRSKFK